VVKPNDTAAKEFFMKRFRIFSLILAVLLVLGLPFTACDNDSTGGSGGGDGGSSGGGGGGSGSFANTNWRSSYSLPTITIETRLSFITSGDWAIYMNNVGAWQQTFAGTYTVSGGTATLMVSSIGEYGKATISGNTLTLIGLAAQYGSSWTRETGNSGSVAVTGVSLNKSNTNLDLGGMETLYEEIDPPNATNKNVTWSSNNTAVATVSAGGTITGLAAGSATITVTTVDGGKKATCAVNVTVSTSAIPTFYNVEDFLAWLRTKPQNTKNNPYAVALNLSSLTDSLSSGTYRSNIQKSRMWLAGWR
jgi:hypothetical protein